MPSAVLFLPDHIMELTNFVTRSDPYTGSGSTVRFAICPLRGIKLALAPRHYPWPTPASPVTGGLPTSSADDYFGLLAPYFDLPCLRFATPTASSVPRITW